MAVFSVLFLFLCSCIAAGNALEVSEWGDTDTTVSASSHSHSNVHTAFKSWSRSWDDIGKNHKKKKKKKHKKEGKEGGDDKDSVCTEGHWRDKVVKIVHEIPVAGLFQDLGGHPKFEGSGITSYKGSYAIVFDSLQEVGMIGPNLQYNNPVNKLLGEPGVESLYEAICHRTRTDTLLAVQEGVLDPDTAEGDEGVWFAHTVEMKLGADGQLSKVSKCKIDFPLPEGDGKGWEGAHYIDKGAEGEFLIGLCEGNHCEGSKGRGKHSGNGRLVITKFNPNATSSDDPDSGREWRHSFATQEPSDEDSDEETEEPPSKPPSDHPSGPQCLWETQKVVKLPKSAKFEDFSDIDIQMSTGRVIVSSQEESAVWIGHIDLDTFELKGDGVVYYFPRSPDGCQALYCNIEGIHFIDDVRIMAVSDKAKKTQPWNCVAKDQSVHIFALPE